MNMSRFLPYLGAIALVAVFVFFGTAFSNVQVVSQAPIVLSEIIQTVPQEQIATSSQAEPVSSPAMTPAPAVAMQKKSAEPSVPAVQPIPVQAPKYIPTDAELDAAASAARAALINILCYAPAGSGLRSTSGSGIFVDSKGIILTNAHVALPFLLADRGVSCVIRSGSPAVERYEAKLAYMSPEWIKANADILTEVAPSGTGEYDFALLAVTKSVNNTPLPDLFPFVPLAVTPPSKGAPIVIASYGAQFLESSQIQSALSPIIVFGSIKDIFTFEKNTIDVLALGGSAAAQEGSSGGGVVDGFGKLIGIITTSTISGTTDTRSLDAISASYIRAEYASETGQPLDLFLAKSSVQSIADFAPQIPELEAIITAQLH